MNKNDFSNLIQFWKRVEALSPQNLPQLENKDPRRLVQNWKDDELPPWSNLGFKRRIIGSNRMWTHTIYGAVYEHQLFMNGLYEQLGKPKDVYEERTGGSSAAFVFTVKENGHPVAESFTLSMAAWAWGVIKTHGLKGLDQEGLIDLSDLHEPEAPLSINSASSGFAAFDKLQKALQDELAWRSGMLRNDEAISLAWVEEFSKIVIDKCRIEELIGKPTSVYRVASAQIWRPSKEKEDAIAKTNEDFLNSFFVKDLNDLANFSDEVGIAFRQYLEPEAGAQRLDVSQEIDKAFLLLSPSLFPQGCWPAEHPLVWSQQLAINSLWQKLKPEPGLFAINGPPGTGKTTLLRDLVAAVIVERAKVLVNLGAGAFEGKKTVEVGSKKIPYYPLSKKLDGFSIVVASSNNGAVDNVSLELPKNDAIAKLWQGKTDFFPQIATELINNEHSSDGFSAWALIAGRLGNKMNRSEFSSKFWWGRSEDGKKSFALFDHLSALASESGRPTLAWSKAVDGFNAAIFEEGKLRADLKEDVRLFQDLAEIDQGMSSQQEIVTAAKNKQGEFAKACHPILASTKGVQTQLNGAQEKFRRIERMRPRFWEILLSFGKAYREWHKEWHVSHRQLEAKEDQLEKLTTQIQIIEQQIQLFAKKERTALNEIESFKKKKKRLSVNTIMAQQKLGEHWPDWSKDNEALEKSSPWSYPTWRDARIKVFLAALDLHKAFIEENAARMKTNLALAMDVLAGVIPSAKIKKIGFDSLAIACPVLSTTFASVGTMFGNMGAGSLGWLLIDEAGQAAPQAAAGALFRSLRAVIVGDPLQLEPVMTLPRSVEIALANHAGNIEERYHSSKTSVQGLADSANPIGTFIGQLWVGAPLRVHRRCDNPMFKISNEIAYNGLMVHHKNPTNADWMKSAWFDVTGGTAEGNWIPEEGRLLEQLLHELLRSRAVPAEEIFLISPYRDVAHRLRGIARKYQLNNKKVGTVHTAQGKEAHVVILVLGGGSVGARDWAAQKPNLLNVAVSRGKSRLYVIGNRKEWSKRKYFDVLAREVTAH